MPDCSFCKDYIKQNPGASYEELVMKCFEAPCYESGEKGCVLYKLAENIRRAEDA
jgi:hypothetical protein